MITEQMIQSVSISLDRDYNGSQVTLLEYLHHPCSAVFHYTTTASAGNDDNVSDVTIKVEDFISTEELEAQLQGSDITYLEYTDKDAYFIGETLSRIT